MAKRWRALHARRQRPRSYCEFRYHNDPHRDWEGTESSNYHPTKRKCDRAAQVECRLNPWDKEFDRYCCEHAGAEGYCMGCGLFCAGMERFDFGPYRGFCDNCADEIRSNEDDEFDYEEAY